MAGTVKGSAFSTGDNFLFYSLADFGGRKTKTSAQNDTAITYALGQMITAGGGVLLIPHGFANSFSQSSFPATVTPLAVWILTADSFKFYANTVSSQEFGPYTKIGGQILGKKLIAIPASGNSIQIADDTQALVVNAPATLAALTITLPQNPQDGNMVHVFSLNAITSLTLAAGSGEGIATGHTVSTLAALQSVKYVYDLATNSWYRLE